jgi:hypothetical protein
MNVARDTAAVCTFESQWLYVFGGRVKFDERQLTNVIERALYTPKQFYNWEVITL